MNLWLNRCTNEERTTTYLAYPVHPPQFQKTSLSWLISGRPDIIPLPSCDRTIIFSQMVTTFMRTLSTTDIINFSRKHGYSCIILTGILQQKWPVRSGVRDPLQSSWASMWPRTLESVYPMRAGGSVWRMSSRRRGSLSKPKTSPCPTFWSTSALDFGKSRCSCTLHWTACGALAYQEGTSQQLAHRFAWLTLMRCMWF